VTAAGSPPWELCLVDAARSIADGDLAPSELVESALDVRESVQNALVRTTAPFNLTGLPAVAVPTGVGASGLPGSVQFAARPFDERTALRLARAVERAAGALGAPHELERALAPSI